MDICACTGVAVSVTFATVITALMLKYRRLTPKTIEGSGGNGERDADERGGGEVREITQRSYKNTTSTTTNTTSTTTNNMTSSPMSARGGGGVSAASGVGSDERNIHLSMTKIY